jgi:hypothetical protein
MYDMEMTPPATWRDALRAEMRPVRPLLAPFPLLMLVGGMAIMAGLLLMDLREGIFDTRWAAGLVVIGAMGAIEQPSRRLYRLTLPVSRPVHALARAFARWVTAPLVLAGLMGLASLLAYTLAGFPAEHAGAIAEGTLRLLVGATIVFLLVYAVALHTDRVLLWIFTPFFVFVLGMALREVSPLASLGSAIEQISASLVLAVVGRSWLDAALGWTWSDAAAVWIPAGMLAVLVSAALLRER